MINKKNYLCRDINDNVHIINQSELIQRSSVYAVIRNENGILLVLDQTSEKRWDLPGGGIEKGENIFHALKREIKEETGLQVVGLPKKICEFIEYFYNIDSKEGWESHRFFFEVVCEGEPVLNGNHSDIKEVGFFKEPFSLKEISPVTIMIIAMTATLNRN